MSRIWRRGLGGTSSPGYGGLAGHTPSVHVDPPPNTIQVTLHYTDTRLDHNARLFHRWLHRNDQRRFPRRNNETTATGSLSVPRSKRPKCIALIASHLPSTTSARPMPTHALLASATPGQRLPHRQLRAQHTLSVFSEPPAGSQS